MLTPAMGQRPPAGEPFATDTGSFARPEDHDDDRYLEWLRELPLERCLFATAPDRFNDGAATLELALPMLPRIRELGVPPALVLQTGMTSRDIPWEWIDVLFVGGPDDWQHSEPATELILEARLRGKRVHVGRVNGLKRLRWAASLGAESVDGTFLRYGPDANEPRLRRWIRELELATPIVWTLPDTEEPWEFLYQLAEDPEVND